MEQISNNGWKIIMRQWKVTGMVRKKGPWRGREMWTSQTCYTFLPSPALNVYLECLFGASGAAQIWLLFIKYLQWLAAFINKFPIPKRRSYCLHITKRKQAQKDLVGFNDAVICSFQASITYPPKSSLCSFSLYLTTASCQKGDERIASGSRV